MNSDWPISIREAARRIGLNQTIATVLVKTHKLPTVGHPLYNAKGLTRTSYRRLERLAAPFVRQQKESATA